MTLCDFFTPLLFSGAAQKQNTGGMRIGHGTRHHWNSSPIYKSGISVRGKAGGSFCSDSGPEEWLYSCCIPNHPRKHDTGVTGCTVESKFCVRGAGKAVPCALTLTLTGACALHFTPKNNQKTGLWCYRVHTGIRSTGGSAHLVNSKKKTHGACVPVFPVLICPFHSNISNWKENHLVLLFRICREIPIR